MLDYRKTYNCMLQAFDAMSLNYFVVEIKCDNNGKPIDVIYREVSPATIRLIGKSEKEILGKSRRELFGNVTDEFPEKLFSVLQTGQPVHFESYGAALNKYYDVYAWKATDIRVALMVTDITERKEAQEILKKRNEQLELIQEKLEEKAAEVEEYASRMEELVEIRSRQIKIERERFYSMLENMPVMVGLFTADYKVLFANRMFREKFGEAKGRCCYEYIGCVSTPCDQCQSFEPLKTGKPHHWTATFSDGTVVDAHDFPFVDADGTKLILEADVDITDRINLQKQLQDKERLAAIGQTAGMVGHDLKNPLQAIISELYFTKKDISKLPRDVDKEAIQESLDQIETSAQYMNKIVMDLQDFARPLKPELVETDLSVIVSSILKTVDFPDNINLNVDLKDLTKLRTDPSFIRRSLTNLVNNAIQAMPKGGTLEIKGYQNGDKIYLTVSDSGMGIPEEIKPKLYTPMITTKSKGQGFGLAVVKRLIEALNGTISFDSQVGKGTVFKIELPTGKL